MPAATLTPPTDDPARLRNTVYLPLLRAGDMAGAAVVNQALILADPAAVVFQMDRASLALRRKDRTQAGLAAAEVWRLAPGDAAAAVQVMQVWLALGDVAQAAGVAQQTEALWPGHARLAQMAMTALYRARDMAAALRAAEAAVAAGPGDLAVATAAAGVFLTNLQASAAIAALERAGAGGSGDARAMFELGRARAMLDLMDDRGLTALQQAAEADPLNHRTADLLARQLMARGQHAQAREVLLAVPVAQRSDALTVQLARAMARSGQVAQALDLYGGLVARNPVNDPLRRAYCGTLVKAGQEAAAVAVYAEGLHRRMAALPVTFAEGVAQLTVAPQGVIAQVRLDWVHGVLTRAGRAPLDRATWQAEVTLVNRIDALMLDWVECRPDRAAELVPYLGDLQRGGDVLRAALSPGKGVFMATAHIGLLLGGPPALHALGIDAAWLSSVPNFLDRAYFRNLISTSSENQATIGRSILKALRRGAVVGIAIDGLSLRGDRSYPLFDKKVQLSDFLPRMAYRFAVRSFFPRLPWAGAGMAGDVLPLPDPLPGEGEDDFVARWMRAYLDEVEAFILDHPTSIRGSGGFWGTIAA